MKLLFVCLLFCSACSSTQCQTLTIDIFDAPNKKPPAGRVELRCDGSKLFEVTADNVQGGGK